MQCHTSSKETQSQTSSSQEIIALVGHHNVGKSVMFHRLTGHRTMASNYPGTTVEVTRGAALFQPEITILDTPGVITFPPRSEDERVTARVLFHDGLQSIIQVGDAKNLHRTLLLTLQLAEMGKPMALALNMTDEANARGVEIDIPRLEHFLTLPVVPTVATQNKGIQPLIQAIQSAERSRFRLNYPQEIETAITEISAHLPDCVISKRAMVLLWLSHDTVADEWIRSQVDQEIYQHLLDRRDATQLAFTEPLSTVIMRTRLEFIDQLVPSVLLQSGSGWWGFSARLGQITTHPLWGLPLLLLVLYALYWFVGIFGAGTLVDFMETQIFGETINPWVIKTITRIIPIPLLSDFLVGDFGLWTMGMTYALALILPIVTTFFLAFSVLEDSGYLPRLSVLTNRVFQFMGLNGKAIVPMVLGLGCVTMATLTTRILENKRDRLLVILLLALAIPCSAQLGVVMGMLSSVSFSAMLIWSGVVLGVLLIVGWLAAKILPGERSVLLVELPPLRLPILSNVVMKTIARLEWYLKEVVPLFLLGTMIMFVLDKSGILPWIIRLSEPLIAGWLGLPPETSAAFIMGFLRRDFGATGLFVMQSQGLLSQLQVVVAMVTITLFIPCIASVFMIARERGLKTSLAIIGVIFPLAFLVGGGLYRVLLGLGWGI
jgi:ferrous iron transport protein B